MGNFDKVEVLIAQARTTKSAVIRAAIDVLYEKLKEE